MKTLIAAPSYNGWRANGKALYDLALSKHPHDLFEPQSSALTMCFNNAWALALSNRRDGITHFAMIHADIIPVHDRWFDLLLEEALSVEADILSVVSPLKGSAGLTSTALDTDKFRPRRLSTAEVKAMPLATWTGPQLLVNTGLMVVDMRKPWVEEYVFDVNNRIVLDERIGRYSAEFEPEDWHLSRFANAHGAKVFATKKIRLHHRGEFNFPNDGVWGLPTDTINP
jgi:hypothetical protein